MQRKSLNSKRFPFRKRSNYGKHRTFNEMFDEVSVLLYFPTVSSEEFVAVDDDNVRTDPIMADKDILDFVQSSKRIIDADFGDENEMNHAALARSSSEKRNIMTSRRSYLDTHSKGKINKKWATSNNVLKMRY
ncbi:hypothetical protein TNCV_4851041 [Trichonephila clavipes]|nr:hypothetical protein TNCV_4851041 [Trichonephila clavipes]